MKFVLTGKMDARVIPFKTTRLYINNYELNTVILTNFTRITHLFCDRNHLFTLLLPKSLVHLSCSHNKLRKLNISRCKSLRFVDCSYNVLGSLTCANRVDTSRRPLIHALKSEYRTGARLLVSLKCSYNRLQTLDLAYCEYLRNLNCEYNNLISLYLYKYALEHINLDHNQLRILDASEFISLKTFRCSDNKCTVLHVNGCKSLTTLECERNRITALTMLPQSINQLLCDGNTYPQDILLQNGEATAIKRRSRISRLIKWLSRKKASKYQALGQLWTDIKMSEQSFLTKMSEQTFLGQMSDQSLLG